VSCVGKGLPVVRKEEPLRQQVPYGEGTTIIIIIHWGVDCFRHHWERQDHKDLDGEAEWNECDLLKRKS
jgi:hypothetical protein